MLPKKQMICLSNRSFTPSINPPPDRHHYGCKSYKPNVPGYMWFSQKSKNKGYLSEWHHFCTTNYPDGFDTIVNSEGKTNMITAELSDTTICINPSKYKKILKQIRELYVQNSNLSYLDKRLILLEAFKRTFKRRNISHVICQIDSIEDVTTLEQIFSPLIPPEEDVDLVRDYHKKCTFMASVIESFFSGVELTERGYEETRFLPEMRGWDMPCWGIFDTDSIDVISEDWFHLKINDLSISF